MYGVLQSLWGPLECTEPLCVYGVIKSVRDPLVCMGTPSVNWAL